MVSAVVCTSPDRSRSPSGAAETTVPNSPLNWRQTASATPITTGSSVAVTPGRPVATMTAASAAITTPA
jgi:hypothetical protein